MFGAGSWGTAFSMVLADAGHEVTIWGRREEVCDAINDNAREPRLPARTSSCRTSITATHDPAEAGEGADARRARRAVADACGPTSRTGPSSCPSDAPLVSLMKGVELGTLKRMSEVISEVTGAGPERVAVLSGPNLAREIASP